MKSLIFASSFTKEDLQTQVLREALEYFSKEYIVINPFSHDDISRIELVYQDGIFELVWNGDVVSPASFYVCRKWRSDCIISIPLDCENPSLYRSKVNLFLTDMYIAFRDCRWLPGTIEKIESADSKPHLLSLAYAYGLNPPQRTVNSFGNPELVSYRKSLSDPFSISYNLSEGCELAVTLFNENNPTDSNGGIPWQWQSYLKPRTHVRCIVVDGSIWTYSASEKQFGGKSLREAQENQEILWSRDLMPDVLTQRLLALMHKMEISIACPEFIVDNLGHYHFIDMNPCGDWYGFGSHDESVEIAQSIAKML